MKREITDVARSELIGLLVTVNGHEGSVVDETKNTFLVERENGSILRIPKAGNRFVFLVGNERFVVRDGVQRHASSTTVVVDGDEIMFRPEDRTKKVRS